MMKLGKESSCPFCSAIINASTDLNGDSIKPKIGDLSICSRCGAWLVFRKDLTVREARQEDLESFKKT